MSLHWLTGANPVAIWWGFLLAVSAVNLALLLGLRAGYRFNPFGGRNVTFAFEPAALLGAVYVLGCAFRSILPRADVQRICLFDTWLSSVMVGRSVATVAELCFAIQWAIILHELGKIAHSDTAKNIAKAIVPLIAVAELCSWYAVISTNFLGNVLENSLWTATFVLIGDRDEPADRKLSRPGPIYHRDHCRRHRRLRVLHVHHRRADVFCAVAGGIAAGHQTLGLLAGLHDVATRWVVTHSFAQWRNEIPWMSLYFSVAVWTSLMLGSIGLVRHLLPRYRVRRPLLKPTRRPIAVPVRSSR